MTTNDFPRILTLLRKERGISQKQVAQDLSISQALLSHYEKGIRECGLNFVIKAADYYGVSCDYLLGRSPHRSGAVLSIKDTGAHGKKETYEVASKTTEYNRRITVNTLNIIFGILKKINNETLTKEMSAYISSALYRAYRILYSANSKNPKSTFGINQKVYDARVLSTMVLSAADCQLILSGESTPNTESVKKEDLPVLTSEVLSKEFPNLAPSLFDLIKGVETEIK